MLNLVKISETYIYQNLNKLKEKIREVGYTINKENKIKIPGLKSDLAEISNGELKVNFRTENCEESLEFRKNLVKFMDLVEKSCYF